MQDSIWIVDASGDTVYANQRMAEIYKPFIFPLRRLDGSAIRVDVLGTPLYNAAGVFHGILGTFTVAS